MAEFNDRRPGDAKALRRHLIDDHGFHHTVVRSMQLARLTHLHEHNHGPNGVVNPGQKVHAHED